VSPDGATAAAVAGDKSSAGLSRCRGSRGLKRDEAQPTACIVSRAGRKRPSAAKARRLPDGDAGKDRMARSSADRRADGRRHASQPEQLVLSSASNGTGKTALTARDKGRNARGLGVDERNRRAGLFHRHVRSARGAAIPDGAAKAGRG